MGAVGIQDFHGFPAFQSHKLPPHRPMEKLQVSDDEAEGLANQCKTQGVSRWMEKGIVSGKCITNSDSDSIVSSSLFAFAASYGS